MNDKNQLNAPIGSTSPSSTSRERLLTEADRLFSIGWLIHRLMKELRSMMLPPDSVAKHPLFFYSLSDDAERWFVWHMLHGHQSSLPRTRELLSVLEEGDNLRNEVMDERRRMIQAFVRYTASKRWDMLQDDDRSWREYARMVYKTLAKDPKTEQVFFDTVGCIAMLTEVLCGRAHQYFFNPNDEDRLKLKAFMGGGKVPDFLASGSPTVGLKGLLSGEWLRVVRRSPQFDEDWCDMFVNALLTSEHGEAIARDWKLKSQIMMGYVIGSLKAAGVFRDHSNLSIAKEILTPFYGDIAKELKKKSSTFANYMGQAKDAFFHVWVVKYVSEFD
ncbi:MAG: hypothetical protein J5502_08230 [Prevotella sp.]|nr:hypothetical protein [Prevotella sp.]